MIATALNFAALLCIHSYQRVMTPHQQPPGVVTMATLQQQRHISTAVRAIPNLAAASYKQGQSLFVSPVQDTPMIDSWLV
jgi:hypothetical protein